MRHHNKPPSEAALARAAELRSLGNTWEAVAAKLNRSVETVRKWPTRYPERWKATLHAAERRIVAEAGDESLFILRQLLRSEDPKIRWHAARSLLQLRVEHERLDLRAAAQQSTSDTLSEAQQAVALLESHTDEQLANMVAGSGPPPAVLPPDPQRPGSGPR